MCNKLSLKMSRRALQNGKYLSNVLKENMNLADGNDN